MITKENLKQIQSAIFKLKLTPWQTDFLQMVAWCQTEHNKGYNYHPKGIASLYEGSNLNFDSEIQYLIDSDVILKKNRRMIYNETYITVRLITLTEQFIKVLFEITESELINHTQKMNNKVKGQTIR